MDGLGWVGLGWFFLMLWRRGWDGVRWESVRVSERLDQSRGCGILAVGVFGVFGVFFLLLIFLEEEC